MPHHIKRVVLESGCIKKKNIIIQRDVEVLGGFLVFSWVVNLGLLFVLVAK